jgi:hypothetical protein
MGESFGSAFEGSAVGKLVLDTVGYFQVTAVYERGHFGQFLDAERSAVGSLADWNHLSADVAAAFAKWPCGESFPY